jgi:FAD dependent oxidoreductase TIGR03364
MTTTKIDIAIVGAGIVGLAHALAAARKGLSVAVFERDERPVGASIRNFGLPWPVGLALTPVHERALRSRALWLETAREAGFWLTENGSLFLAYHPDEEAVLREFLADAAAYSSFHWLGPHQVGQRSPAANLSGLRGGLFSATELTVDPREVIRTLPGWLEQAYGVVFHFGSPVSAIHPPYLETPGQTWQAQQILLCSGPDLETLYPEVYTNIGMTKCKLQMMRFASPAPGWQLGPTLASGLTIARYENFAGCASIHEMRNRLELDWPEQTRWGIHIMLAQNGLGELVIGDTHEYGPVFDPTNNEWANQLMLDYLATFSSIPDLRILERWNGFYPKLDGRSELVAKPEDGVTIVQITNGLGMTLSFGLAEEVIRGL